MQLKQLERILYFESYVVLEPGLTALEKNQLLTEDELLSAQDEYGEDAFSAGIGAEAVKTMNGERKTIYAPANGPVREAVLIGSLALSVLWKS